MNKVFLSLVVLGVSLAGCSSKRELAPATGYSNNKTGGQYQPATAHARSNASATTNRNTYDNPHLDYSKGGSSRHSPKSRAPYSFDKGYSK